MDTDKRYNAPAGGSGESSITSPPTSRGGTLSGSQVNDPITAVIKGVVDIGNNLVNNLFNRKRVKEELRLKENEQNFRQSLSVLDNQQKYVLNQRLNEAKTQTERLKILSDAVALLQVAKIQQAGLESKNTLYIVFGSSLVLIGLLVVIKKID